MRIIIPGRVIPVEDPEPMNSRGGKLVQLSLQILEQFLQCGSSESDP